MKTTDSNTRPAWRQALDDWWPARTSIDRAERLRACAGALIGIAFTGLLSAGLLGPASATAWLMAPMGASAVLLFVVPSSPLAQPWPVLGGNVVAALVGVSCAKLIGWPPAAAAAAVALAIAAMLALRCLHPPSGAVALTAVVGGPDISAAGYAFALSPVLLNSALLLFAALLYNRAVGRDYPQRSQAKARHPHGTADVDAIQRMGFTPADLSAALKDHKQLLDISVEDLDALFRRTEMQAYGRHFGRTICSQIMSRDVLTVEYATELEVAWKMMREHGVRGLPVIDRSRRVVGIITRSDFLAHAELQDYRSAGARLRNFLRRTPHSHSDKHEVVGQIMGSPVRTVPETLPIVELVPLMTDLALHHLPVVNAERRLVGMVTQTDLVAALYETSLGQMGARESAALTTA